MAEIRNTDELLDLIKSLNTFKWDLIFFKKTGSNNNIFTCYEVKIDKKSFDEYINSLIKEETFILENSIESVDEYNGDNPITSCIKIYFKILFMPLIEVIGNEKKKYLWIKKRKDML